jgi:hypothetical protein
VLSLKLIEFWIFLTQYKNELSHDDDVQYEYDQEQGKNAYILKFFPKVNALILVQNRCH